MQPKAMIFGCNTTSEAYSGRPEEAKYQREGQRIKLYDLYVGNDM